MAIIEMKKLTLLAMQSDKERIFDALARSRNVELKRSAEIDACTTVDATLAREKLAEKIAAVEDGISYVSARVAEFNALHKRDKNTAEVKLPKNSFARPLAEVNFDYFIGFGEKAESIDGDLQLLADLRKRLNADNAEIAQRNAELARVKPLAKLPHATTWYKDTDSAIVQLSQVNVSELARVNELALRYETVTVENVDSTGSSAVVIVVAHKSEADFFKEAASCGLVKCGVVADKLPSVVIEDIERQIEGYKAEIKSIEEQVTAMAPKISEWKIYVDYLEFSVQKLSAEGDLQQTNATFVMEAYCPVGEEDKVRNAIESVTGNYLLNFDDIAEGEFAPTLIKNNKIVKPFESVTNMYSSPAYHEIDPNPVMSVFYFIIFGFMVADIGYGALLFILGLAATFVIKQQTGLKTMLQMFGMCGLSAIVVGALFGSVFCYSAYEGIIPPPDQYPMVMMIISLLLGIVHVSAGIACKMALKIKRKQYAAAWLADFPWIITFASLVLAIFNAAMDMAAYEKWAYIRLPSIVSQVALYVCLGSLAVGIIFAGLGQKGFLGKVKSSFGSAYGLINYFSDVMSYIRVFGLMLSGSLVGSVFNHIGGMLATNAVGYVVAALLLVVLHVFNLAMSILSVYIHNGRLQYVEFFGKFYEGDGELFKPFGSISKYTLIKDE